MSKGFNALNSLADGAMNIADAVESTGDLSKVTNAIDAACNIGLGALDAKDAYDKKK